MRHTLDSGPMPKIGDALVLVFGGWLLLIWCEKHTELYANLERRGKGSYVIGSILEVLLTTWFESH